jgi:hypothetical protein
VVAGSTVHAPPPQPEPPGTQCMPSCQRSQQLWPACCAASRPRALRRYFLLPASLKATDTVTLTLDDGELDEGFYHLSAKVQWLPNRAAWRCLKLRPSPTDAVPAADPPLPAGCRHQSLPQPR